MKANPALRKDVALTNTAQFFSGKYAASAIRDTQADERIRTFQADSARQAGIFHHLITLPTYHTAALSTDDLAKEYFAGDAALKAGGEDYTMNQFG